MTIFVAQGDKPLTEAQISKRTQAYICRDWPEWERERSIRLNDGQFNTYMEAVAADTDINRANNLFNEQIVAYVAAVERLGRYQLSVGKDAVMGEQPIFDENGLPVFDENGEQATETVEIAPAIDPLDATVEQPVYNEDGEQTGTETVPNPLIVADDAERAAAQDVIDNTPPGVIAFVNAS